MSKKKVKENIESKIDAAVKHYFIDHVINHNEIDVYRATAGIKKEGLKTLILFDEFILEWIKKIVAQNDIGPELKLKTLETIFKYVKMFDEGEGIGDD